MTSGRILIASFTNHALDQFAEDLLDVGVDAADIVRLGSKSTSRTKSMLMRNKPVNNNLSRSDWAKIDTARNDVTFQCASLEQSFRTLTRPVDCRHLLQYLEFADEDLPFFEAFQVHDSHDMRTVGKRGKRIDQSYVFQQWLRGSTRSGVNLEDKFPDVWLIEAAKRRDLVTKWTELIRSDSVETLSEAGRRCDDSLRTARATLSKRDEQCLSAHRIIACTTTGAAKLVDTIKTAEPEVVLFEEAGEILEPHVLTTISMKTKRLVMIGDHRQLRPKIKSYRLQVESGHGYDLNRSLFERLVIQHFPHTTLSKQHRMRPEISDLVRRMTYPLLQDGSTTLNRDPIRGLQRNVVFIDHRNAESNFKDLNRNEAGASKQNLFEAEMTLRIVKYLAQQGYGSEDIVVLTPYLAQLRLLRNTLARENDPVLNDLDYYELLKYGLIDSTTVSNQRRGVRLSSIGKSPHYCPSPPQTLMSEVFTVPWSNWPD